MKTKEGVDKLYKKFCGARAGRGSLNRLGCCEALSNWIVSFAEESAGEMHKKCSIINCMRAYFSHLLRGNGAVNYFLA